MRVKAIEAVLLNTRSFRSFQRTQTVVNQIILKNKVDDRCIPGMLINCVKCWVMSTCETEDIPNQSQTYDHSNPKMSHPKNKWFAVSCFPQPATQAESSWEIILRRIKLSLVGSLLRRRRHTNTDTLEGLKTKLDIFIETKNLFYPIKNH